MEHLNRTIQEQEQMDDLYGFVMVVDKEKKYDEVLDFIKKYTL